ncbi:uncharacterized protein LOC125659688 [Ostrea edulis]|uniref:uncharacterized protein LOC125659688 n=1 Tax=Ostrea edulis TaxID=37623 RepID=UPI0024AF662F|nr:uncharacterized protein LOC125659688 [Ostrea edulis]
MADIHLEIQCKPYSRFSYINSTLAPTCILFVCIVILIIFSTSKAIPSPRPVVWGTEAAITFISMIFTFVILFLVNRNKRRYLGEADRGNVSLNIKLVFLWLFGLTSVFNSGLNMTINIDCLIHGGPQPFPFEQIISILCHTTEILFCIGQLGFLSIYGKYRFKSSTLINYSLSFMVIAHLLRWCRDFFDSIIKESMTSPYNKTNDCFFTSHISFIREKFHPYIGQIMTEFCLLSVVVAIRMFVMFNNVSGKETRQPSTHQVEPSSITSWETCPMQRCSTSVFVSIMSGILLSIPLMITKFLNNSNVLEFSSISRVISITYNLEVLLLLCFAYIRFTTRFHETRNRQAMETTHRPVLIFVTAGSMAYTTFGCIAGIMSSYQLLGRILLVDNICQSVVILFQTMLILHVQTFCLKDAYVHVTGTSVHNTFLCIFVMNTIYWILSAFSFGESDNLGVIQVGLYGKKYWGVILQTLFPIVLFYRFITSIEMYELYRKTIVHSQRAI